MKSIFLIGFMGSGKSTVGQCLADQLDWQFVDTDLYFEEREQMMISAFFAQYGEEEFRVKEQSCLQLCTKPNTVNGIVVYLQTSFEEICARLKDDHTRPLFQADHLVCTKARLESRLSLYQGAAHYTLDTVGKNPLELAREIQAVVNV